MAGLNWYLQIRNLAKSDARAAELFEQLKTAESDDDKENAKIAAQNYIQEIQTTSNTTAETNPVAENTDVVLTENQQDTSENVSVGNEENTQIGTEKVEESGQESPKEQTLTDLSQPAFTPRLAKFGITREEELFLHGVFVRKMNRDEKILMRRSIYQKKTLGAAKIQAEFKKKRIEQKIKDANDPEKQRYHQERKYINSIVDALNQHCNLGWIFKNIEGLTVDMVREFIKKPGYANAFTQADPNFIDNFNKKYNL